MEHKLGLVESGCTTQVNRGSHGAASVAEEEAFDKISEEQSACEEAGDRGPIPHDTGRATLRFPQD